MRWPDSGASTTAAGRQRRLPEGATPGVVRAICSVSPAKTLAKPVTACKMDGTSMG